MFSTKAGLRKALLHFYRKEARKLPWRELQDPYAIWISEVMLQQTQVKTVIPRFQQFLNRYHTVHDLALASEREICEAFAGMGYYRRAQNLHRAARTIVNVWHGSLPTTLEGLRSLPGIGEYTAAAIASIAFQKKVAAVDGNLIRVLARVFALPGKRNDTRLVSKVRCAAEAVVQGKNPGEMNQSLMDLGASICTPTKPDCRHCPINRYCQAYASGCPENFPESQPAIQRKKLKIVFAWVKRGKKVLLEKRPLSGLWPGLWELPSETGDNAKKHLEKRLGISLGRPQKHLKHTLSHRNVLATVHLEVLGKESAENFKHPHQKFSSVPLTMPLSTLARKAILAMVANQVP